MSRANKSKIQWILPALLLVVILNIGSANADENQWIDTEYKNASFLFDTADKACDVFSTGTFYTSPVYAWGSKIHTGCDLYTDTDNDGVKEYYSESDSTCHVLGPIFGIDYITEEGTPILAPFNGYMRISCAHDLLSDPNTYSTFTSEDGKWTVKDFHMLEGSCTPSGTYLHAGEQIALIGSVGRSTTAHTHRAFVDNSTGLNVEDHDYFHNCGVSGSPLPNSSSGDSTTPSVSVVGPIEYSLAPYAGRPKYLSNMQKVLAWPASGQNLDAMNENLASDGTITGGWYLNPGNKVNSGNAQFGSEAYEEGQGQVVAESGGIGDGACDISSQICDAAVKLGLECVADANFHKSDVPGTDRDITVCVPTNSIDSCKGKADYYINTKTAVIFNYKLDLTTGKTSYWLEYNGTVPNAQAVNPQLTSLDSYVPRVDAEGYWIPVVPVEIGQVIFSYDAPTETETVSPTPASEVLPPTSVLPTTTPTKKWGLVLFLGGISFILLMVVVLLLLPLAFKDDG